MTILNHNDLGPLRRAYEDDLVPVQELANRVGVTRAAVYKFFKKHGVETRKGVATRRPVSCYSCGKAFTITRSRVRQGNRRHFCSSVCYRVYLENKDSRLNRQKQRIGRLKVGQVFALKPGHVVHHRDGDHFNTDIANFMVFANQSDHIRYHHQVRQGLGVTVKPVFDGRRFGGAGKPVRRRIVVI